MQICNNIVNMDFTGSKMQGVTSNYSEVKDGF